MTKLPRGLSSKQVIKALTTVGFVFKRQKGSHIVLRRDHPYAQVVVPNHQSLDTGTLDTILEGAGISADEFIILLKS